MIGRNKNLSMASKAEHPLFYRYIVSLTKRRLFLLSFATVTTVAGVFLSGFFLGAVYNGAEAAYSETESLALPAETLPVNTADGMPQSTEAEPTDVFNNLITSSDPVNAPSTFNTNDLVFENILSDEQLAQEFAKTNNDLPPSKQNAVAAKRSSKLSSRQTTPTTGTRSAVPAGGKQAKTAVTKSVNPTKQKPHVTRSIKTPAVQTEYIKGVSDVNALNKQRAALYEEYPVSTKTYYYLQLMTTSEVAKGRVFIEKLRNEGFASKLEESVVNETSHYVILIGLYKDKLQAKKHLMRFQTAARYGGAFKDAFIRPYKLAPVSAASSNITSSL